MIRMNIVMKSGAILEAVAVDEEKYREIANALIRVKEPCVLQTEGFFDLFVKPSEVAAVTAELLDDDDDESEDVSDDDENASGDEASDCEECDEIPGSASCEGCMLESPNT